MKQLIIIVAIVVGIIGGAVLLKGEDTTVQGSVSNNFYGLESSPVTITEYGDFECPACAQFFPIFTQVKELYKDRVRFEYKHFPLVQIHPNAIAAHRAAQAAGKQNSFWEMHDLLYERQTSWRSTGAGNVGSASPAPIFEGYAEELGLDMEQYNEDVRSEETIATINADIGVGRGLGAESTPTFFLNGELVEDLNQLATVEGFSAFIDAALEEAGQPTKNPAPDSTAPEETDQTDTSEPAPTSGE